MNWIEAIGLQWELFCKIIPSKIEGQAGGTLFTVAITVDRFFAVCHSLLAKRFLTQARAFAISIAIFVVAVIFSMRWKLSPSPRKELIYKFSLYKTTSSCGSCVCDLWFATSRHLFLRLLMRVTLFAWGMLVKWRSIFLTQCSELWTGSYFLQFRGQLQHLLLDEQTFLEFNIGPVEIWTLFLSATVLYMETRS
jgi:hypothetical protein